LNQILWRHIRGENTKYPGVQRSVFSPFGIDIDDEDREEAEEAAKAAKEGCQEIEPLPDTIAAQDILCF
jgi:hypothetical protein